MGMCEDGNCPECQEARIRLKEELEALTDDWHTDIGEGNKAVLAAYFGRLGVKEDDKSDVWS